MAITRASRSSLRQSLDRYSNALADYTPERGAFESITTVTLGSAQSEIAFTSIPSTYKHLQVRGILQAATGGGNGRGAAVNINNDSTGSNYYSHYGPYQQNNTASAGSLSGGFWTMYFASICDSSTSSFTGVVFNIFDYANTSKLTTMNSFFGSALAGFQECGQVSSVWFNTAVVNRLDFKNSSGSFPAGSRLALYGMR